MTLTPSQRAERAAQAMWAADQASRWVGMALEHVDEAQATLSLKVQSHHVNGHGICHGGVIFSLADSAFAFACNSRNQATVAQHNSITYVAAAKIGDQLIARAREVSLTGRSGIYDVVVSTDQGETIAHFRGHSRSIAGTVYDE